MPAPPSGPGVVPPFAAPPAEGRTIRIWLGIGTAVLGVLLCCGGGTAAVIGLGVAGTEAIKEQARVVVGDYLDALSRDEFGEAYRLLCDDVQQQVSRRTFEQRVAAEPDIADYQLGEVEVQDELSVPATITYVGGGRDTQRFRLSQDSTTGDLEVCGIT